MWSMAKKMVFETSTNTYVASGSIGEGGSGVVYRVTDTDGEDYALKLLRDANAKKRKRFKNELAFCRRNQHERIVRVLDDGVVLDGQLRLPFYVMPLYGSTLRKLMEAETPASGALQLFNDVLDGVEAAHLQNVFHRDLKPENLLVEMPGRRVAVADFGIAHFEEEDLLTAVETGVAERLANFRYSAPEQRAPGKDANNRADIYALGLILNEMFTGEVAQGTGYRTIAAAVPDLAYLDPLVEKMIRQDPAARPSSVHAVKDELIMRGTEFVTHQKLDQARKTVVPAATADDPLGGTDVVARGFTWEQGTLCFRLDPEPPPKWMAALHNLGAYISYPGLAEPRLVARTARGATVPAYEHNVAEVARLVKGWVEAANREYREQLRKEAKEQERSRRAELAQRQRRLEEQARANERLRKALLE